jgi:hypothetical protein
MNAIQRRLAAVMLAGGTLIGPPAAAMADGNPDGPPLETVVQNRDTVVVGEDGTGVVSARFPTTVGGDEVRYVIVVENGCAAQPQPEPCPAPIRGLTITLNEDVVFQNDDEFSQERSAVALNPVGSELNSLVMAAKGAPGSGARLAVLAVRPASVSFGGRSVLPWAVTSALERTFLTVHNAGPAEIAFRLVLFNPDGTPAGRSTPHALASHATANLSLAAVAASIQPAWREGAVHVIWVSRLFSRVSTVGNTRQRSLALDDFGPFPINQEELLDVLGSQ